MLAALVLAVPAVADTHVAFVDESGQAANQMYVKGGKIRFESGDHQHVMLYDVASNSMTMVMADKKEYMVFNEQTASQMGAQMQGAQDQAQAAMAAHQQEMSDAQAKMQAAMANMTPEQKAMMQKMMPGGGPPMGPPGGAGGPMSMQLDTKDLGTSETIAGHKCEDMQMSMNGRPMSTLCVMASLDPLGIPATDLKTLQAMKDGMQKIVSKMGPMAQGMTSMMNKGFTIKSQGQRFDPKTMKQVTETNILKGVTTESLSGDLFQVPAGYTQTSMDQMMQQHGAHP
ncbi:MAG TPA: DUF4412 domain-containing protein [Gammaproteobacteria bacterium]|nr:DUF4412 domain-containing protein [Gammaproteobacteria bacterium]